MTDKIITPEIVAQWVNDLSKMVDDNETAHSEEDSIHRGVLQAIAHGRCSNPKACAQIAMKTSELNFARWCA